jgi:hypothetical protein
MAMKFVVCREKQDLGECFSEDITLDRLYELVDEDAGNGMIRIIDASGEDYLYPSSWFEPIALRDSIAVRPHDALTRLAA